METNSENSLKNLMKKYKNDDIIIDSVDMETCLREFKTELYVKRDQVKQLRLDLELSTAEVVELRRALDSNSKTLDEKHFNLNVITKKFRTTEDNLLEKIDALNTIQMQHNLMVTEMETLKESLRKNEADKLDLSRKLDLLETKQRHSYIYHNHILKRETNLKSICEQLENMIDKLKSELADVTELSRKTKLAEESLGKYQQLIQNYEKLKEEKVNFEELYIKINAKCEMLEQLVKFNEDPEPNLMSKIIFSQWKPTRSHYQQQIEKTEEILTNLTDRYNSEKTTNTQLIRKNEQLCKDNKSLQDKIDNLEAECVKLEDLHKIEVEQLKMRITELEHKSENKNSTDVEIKEEPIEIED